MHIVGKRQGEAAAPLELLTVTDITSHAETTITVKDSLGRAYVHMLAEPTVQFTVGGALGYHTIALADSTGHVQDQLLFKVDTETHIADTGSSYQELLQMLLYTCVTEFGERHYVRYDGRIYNFFICWLRDHVHVMKGMKYFSDRLKDGIDLYRDSQREDGMIWDNAYPRTVEPNYWDVRFAKGNFIRPIDNYHSELKRIPVENDVEYLFVEGLYYTWKAVGDDGWMADSLDAAMKAFEYSVTNEYRWSEKYQLLKRGYTIDTWDFQAKDDCVVEGDPMRIEPGKTHFGVMFGDNTGYAVGCDYLAEMLAYVGRTEEAEKYRQRAQDIRQRLNALSWNGQFFTHHVPEEPERTRDLGVDEKTQVSLSNAYSLNRRITHEQCVEIIKTYQRIREQLPEGSPGEWYTIYPPFQRGFGGHNALWQYMNASVTPIVAGELAHGAFEHGFEEYGVDILQRLLLLGKQHGGAFHSCYTGSIPAEPHRTFTPLDISALANIDVVGTGAEGVPGWTQDGENDLHEAPSGAQILADIPFLLPDPATNGRRAAIGLRQRDGYAQRVTVPVNSSAASIYFLHAVSQIGPSNLGGIIRLHYTDGTSYTKYVVRGQNVEGWWMPEENNSRTTKVAWRGKNAKCLNVGLIAYGLDNPHPERDIVNITLDAAEDGGFWGILGITLSEQPVYFPPSPISYGIPNGWSAAAVIYALIEGLAGVVDTGVAYSRIKLAPRWNASTVQKTEVAVKYPASGGYVAYRYHHQDEARNVDITLTGSGEHCDVHLLLPAGVEQVQQVLLDGQAVDFALSQVEQSSYVDCSFALLGVKTITITY